MKGKFYYINVEVWNESHIVWKPFQTPLHPLRDDFVACILVEETYLTLQLHACICMQDEGLSWPLFSKIDLFAQKKLYFPF